ncbi:MAG: hypothetical protein ACO3RT_07905 [Arenicellales bacterium]
MLTLAQWLVLASAVLMLWGGYDYLKDTLMGKTKPNRVSWSLWALAPLISLGAAFSAGADIWASVRVIVGGIVPATVFFASFVNKNSYWRLNAFDWFCGALSVAALVFWQLADSPLLAVLLASAANTLASVPTFIKAWNFPETESRLIFINSFVSSVIIIPAIPEWTVANSAFQISLMTTTALMMVAIFRKSLGIQFTLPGSNAQ